nr:hypothetical protein [Serratia fonticola]
MEPELLRQSKEAGIGLSQLLATAPKRKAARDGGRGVEA